MAEVIVNIKSNTTQAQDSVDDLNKSLDQTADAADAASDSLERQEARIKTLGGAINILGGSVELLAGGLALSGIATEEQVEKFETAAVGAIAFADGAKRVFEGVKELQEGLALATKAQIANNLAVLSNPYVAAAAAVTAFAVALTGALVYFSRADQQLEELNMNLAENVRLTDAQKTSVATQTAELKKLEAIVKDETIAEENRQKALNKLAEILPELEDLDISRADAIGQVTIAIGREIIAIQKRAQVQGLEERLVDLYKQQAQLKEEAIAASNGLIKSEEELRVFLLFNADATDQLNTKFGNLTKQLIETNADIDETSNSIVAMSDYVTDLGNTVVETSDKTRDKVIEVNVKPKIIVPEGDDSPPTLAEWFETNVIDAIEGPELQPIIKPEFDSSALDLGTTTFLDKLVVFEGKIDEFFEGVNGQAVGAVLGAASEFTEALVTVVDDGSEEAFESSKKFKIAEVITSSAQASFEAFAAAQKLNATVPGLGTVLGIALVAAISKSASRAIQNIKSSQYGGDSISGGVGSSPSLPSTGGAQVTGVPAIPGAQFGDSGVTTLNAVVLSGEMTSAQAQDAAIRNRRRFGGGG